MNYLYKYADHNKLPIMDQITFERYTNEIGKEKFREDLAAYIEKERPVFPLKKIKRQEKIMIIECHLQAI